MSSIHHHTEPAPHGARFGIFESLHDMNAQVVQLDADAPANTPYLAGIDAPGYWRHDHCLSPRLRAESLLKPAGRVLEHRAKVHDLSVVHDHTVSSTLT